MNVQVGGSLVGGCLVGGCRVGERRGTLISQSILTNFGQIVDSKSYDQS